MPLTQYTESPRYLRLHEADNVAVIVNDGGISAGTAFGDGPQLSGKAANTLYLSRET